MKLSVMYSETSRKDPKEISSVSHLRAYLQISDKLLNVIQSHLQAEYIWAYLRCKVILVWIDEDGVFQDSFVSGAPNRNKRLKTDCICQLNLSTLLSDMI